MGRVLIVEDNAMNRDVVDRWLRRRGYHTVLAGTAEEGLELAQTHQPDVILMDVDLPGMDGWEATRRLKADDALGDVPVVALTAYALSEHEATAREVGCVGFEPKPLDLDRLVDRLGALGIRPAGAA